METTNSPLIEWGAAALALPGQSESGDQYIAQPFPNGVLVAAVDGLGHGDEAAAAAKLAVTVLERHAHESAISLVRHCHKALRATRGVVMSLASFNALDGTMTWLGVGNVEGRLLRRDPNASPRFEYLLLRGGVVGDQLPPLYASIIPVMPNDMLIFATDGVYSDFTDRLILSEAPGQIADRILAQYSKHADDALVLVARYLGGAP